MVQKPSVLITVAVDQVSEASSSCYSALSVINTVVFSIFFFQFQIFYCHRITQFPNKLYNSSVSCDNEDWTHKSMCPLSMC